MKNRSKKHFARLALAVVAVVAMAAPAYAAEVDNSETEASIVFSAGELKLNSVPVLDFGAHQISHLEENYPAISVDPVIEVSDLRGNGIGWELIVSLSPFEQETSGMPTLQAASIQVNNPAVNPANSTVGVAPTASEVILTSDDQSVRVWKAGMHEGMGVWHLKWNASDTILNVKTGTAQEGKSVASLNWSLQSAP